MPKGNTGKARRHRELKKVVICFAVCFTIIAIYELSGKGSSARERRRKTKNILRNGANKKFSSDIEFTNLTEEEKIDLVVQGKFHLTNLKIPTIGLNEQHRYEGVLSEFCQINWSLHKSEPSSYPMYRDLINKSPSCEKPFRLDIKKVVDVMRNYDDEREAKGIDLENQAPHSLQPNGFVFHESRCGSTLVANSLAAMNPPAYRTYSESAPPIAAAKACGIGGKNCPEGRAAELLRDVIYIMGRTDDPNETHLFFKIQSIGSKYISVFTEAFPDTPWIYVYREPVQIMMSQLAQGVNRANCVHQLNNVPDEKRKEIESHGKKVDDLSKVERCALHLSLLCDSALYAIYESGSLARAVSYDNIVQKLIDHIIPDHFHILMTNDEKENILKVGGQYSKGRGKRKAEFKGDSEEKEKNATPEIREAAKFFLQSSFELLEEEANEKYYGGGV